MANEESEDQPGLGELSEDLFREHEGRHPANSDSAQYQSGKQLPPDIAYQEGREQEIAERGRVGTPGFEGHVTTVFDARPLNARDFLEVQKSRFHYVAANGSSFADPAIATFTVPEGYLGILREFSWTIEDNSILPDNIYITIDDMPVPNYTNLRYLTNNFMGRAPCYILANAGQTIQIVMRQNSLPTSPMDTDVTFYMHGNLLLLRGLPTPFEPMSM